MKEQNDPFCATLLQITVDLVQLSSTYLAQARSLPSPFITFGGSQPIVFFFLYVSCMFYMKWYFIFYLDLHFRGKGILEIFHSHSKLDGKI